MTTNTTTTPIQHTDNATFQAWGSELSTMLAACGLVQTADTGQINWGALPARPGTNTIAGYQIWRFNDAMQGTAPIFLRVQVGTGSGATTPLCTIGVGTGTNGAGTLTGLTSNQNPLNTAVASTSGTARNSYACHADGVFSLFWKQGGTSFGGFNISRTVDSSGVATANGMLVSWGPSSQTFTAARRQAFRFITTAVAFTAQNGNTGAIGFYATAADGGNSSLDGADFQAALCFTWLPRMVPLVGICGVMDSEVAGGNTFSVAMVGATPRTYMAFDIPSSPYVSATIPSASTGGTGPKMAFIWE